MLSAQDLKKLADLSRISVSDEELESLGKEIEPILNYVKEVSTVVGDSAALPPTAGALRNVLREDANPHEGSLHTENLLGQAPDRDGNHLKVKKIL